MILPDFLVREFLVGRYQRLAAPLNGIYVRELASFTDSLVPFLKMFPEQEHFIATLFFEQQLNPMLKAYATAKTFMNSCLDMQTIIRNKRNSLKNLLDNNNATTLALKEAVNELEILETKHKNMEEDYYNKCSNLYPLNILINNMINTNITTVNNNIQHI